MKARLSDQANKIKDGQVPFPMYTCLHVKSNVSAKIFQEWYEFTPFEVCIPKYGVNFKTSDFASKFFRPTGWLLLLYTFRYCNQVNKAI